MEASRARHCPPPWEGTSGNKVGGETSGRCLSRSSCFSRSSSNGVSQGPPHRCCYRGTRRLSEVYAGGLSCVRLPADALLFPDPSKGELAGQDAGKMLCFGSDLYIFRSLEACPHLQSRTQALLGWRWGVRGGGESAQHQVTRGRRSVAHTLTYPDNFCSPFSCFLI